MSKQSEKEFFDESFATSARKPVYKYYAITKSSHEHYRDKLLEHCPGAVVLEYGCGMGSQAFWLAGKSAKVHGIDISGVAIEMATKQAAADGLQNTEFSVMDAEEMTFDDSMFDLVCGSGILHHLDVEKSLLELKRILKPGGIAIFMEPLGYNPALNLFRRLTPRLRTPDEHPLVRSDFKLMRKHFGRTVCRYFHLLSFLAIPFLPTRIFWPMLGFFDKADRKMFRLAPFVGWWAWYTVITLQEPHKE